MGDFKIWRNMQFYDLFCERETGPLNYGFNRRGMLTVLLYRFKFGLQVI